MSTNLPPAGWHPDPENPTGAMRWWDGERWTSNVHPVSAPSGAGNNGAPWGTGGYGGPAWGGGQVPPGGWGAPPSFARRNQASLTALGVGLLYVAVDLTSHLFLIGIFPVLLAFRAMQRKEQLAPAAIVMAVLVIALAVVIR